MSSNNQPHYKKCPERGCDWLFEDKEYVSPGLRKEMIDDGEVDDHMLNEYGKVRIRKGKWSKWMKVVDIRMQLERQER